MNPHIVETDCCIVGGGPAGIMLALLLVRVGVSVILLEAHKTFDRDFRGDTVHPLTLENLEALGLADRLLEIPHHNIEQLTMGSRVYADFSALPTRYPFLTSVPQVKFLELLVYEAKRYPNFQLLMGTNVQELIVEDGTSQERICGVRYRKGESWYEVRASLTIGADGRSSHVSHLAGLDKNLFTSSPPMDVISFRLPKKTGDKLQPDAKSTKDFMLVWFEQSDCWLFRYLFLKGGYQQIRQAGLEAFKQSIAEVLPEITDRLDSLKDWSSMAFLSVQASRVPQWYRPGLLLIGDAAHTMSPVGGVGVNYAMQDAVTAANILSQPLKTKQLKVEHLQAVQNERELPTRAIQIYQSLMQEAINRRLNPKAPIPFRFLLFFWLPLSLPLLNKLYARVIAHLIGFGLHPAHLKPESWASSHFSADSRR